jgi:hypothetical protein
MKTLAYSIIVILLFLFACKKEEDRSPVLAGVYDSSFLFHEFNPPLKVNLKLDSQSKFYIGADSLDINQDGNFDLIIKQRLYLDIAKPQYYTHETYPYCLLTFRNGLEFSKKMQYYIQGHGTYGTNVGIDTLNYENRIDTISEWSGTDTNAALWIDPPTSLTSSNGVWFNLRNAEKYIGIRMKVNSQFKYGWIKVSQVMRENISFSSYALEK